MTFLTDWQASVDLSLADITELVDLDKSLELTYGVVATGLLWPVRDKVEAFDAGAIQAVQEVAPQGSNELLRFLQGWSPEKVPAAREMALAAKQQAALRSALDHIITHFSGMSIFLHHLLSKKLAAQESQATYDVSGLVQGLLVTVGGMTTVQQLNITVGSMIAGNGLALPSVASQPKTEDLLQPYLNWLIAQHERLELRGIKQSEHTGIPLESVYVALRGDRTSPYERQQSQLSLEIELSELEEYVTQLELSLEEKRTLLWQALGRSPWMPSLEERDRPHLFQTNKTEHLSLGEAFRRERWLAILGDPGSGKTTVARWLTLKLAQALLAEQERLVVPQSQIDPAANGTDLADLGPVRLPVLVRISEFADARRENPHLLLADFLGQHSWLGQVPTFSKESADVQGEALPPAQLNLLIKEYLRQQKAVILLDGLDEIAVVDNRVDVIHAVEKFIYDWVVSPAEGEQIRFVGASQALSADYPATRGGNQIVITSRIAGYHAAPLGGQIAHFTIDPMSDRAVDVFCDAWMNVMYADHETAIREAKAFKAEIHHPNNPGVRELASNPLLLTILALIYQAGQSKLPRQRVSLYQMAVGNLAQVWRQRGHNLQHDEVMYVLTQIAYFIHETYSTGLIEETALRDQIARSLAKYRDLPYERLSLAFNEDVSQFMKLLREEVGLLAARGERLYGFLHLSFQEYFAALYLVAAAQSSSAIFLEKLDKPRWREPLLLAFSHISIAWPAYKREELITTFLQANDELKDLLPRSALLLSSALGEMANLPSEPLIQQIILSLLETYSRKADFASLDLLYTTIEQAFRNLNKTPAAALVETTLIEELQYIAPDRRGRGLAAAQLMLKLNWYSARATRALLRALPFDSADWDWIIHKSLIRIMKLHPDYLPPYELPFRHALQQDPEIYAFVKADVDWLRVIILLFGGIIPGEDEEAVASANGAGPQNGSIEFLPTHIYRNALVAKAILGSLQEHATNRGLEKLEAELRGILQHSKVPMERAEALLGLATLGVPLQTLLRDPTLQQEGIFEAALSYADLVTDLLKPLFAEAATSVRREIVHSSIEDDWLIRDLIRGLSKFEANLHPVFQTSTGDLLRIMKDLHPLWLTQYWAEALLGEDPPYSLAVVLDTAGKWLEKMPDKLAKSLAFLQTIPWSNKWLAVEMFPPHILYERDILPEALNVIAGMSPALNHWRSWALEELAELLTSTQRDCIPEALALCLTITQAEFRRTALEALDPTLLQSSDVPAQVFQQALALKEPLARARSLWRLIQILPLKYYLPGLEEAIRSTALIADAQDKSRMYWRLGNLLPISPRKEAMYQSAYKYALKIGNPGNKACALARLAVQVQKQEKNLLALVLEEVGKIKEERSRAEMLRKMRPLIASAPELHPRFLKLVERLPSPHLRWLAQDQLLPQLLAYKPEPENREKYTLVTLIAGLSELHRTLGIPTELDEIWMALADTQRRSRAMKALWERGVQDGLKCTPAAADALNTLIAQGDREPLTRLFPLVQEPDAGLQPILLQWLQSPDAFLQQMASLLLAEANFLSAKTLHHLFTLLEGEQDRLRHRAALALYDKKRNYNLPRFKLSLIGQGTLMLAVQTSKQWREHARGVGSALAWFYENLWIDDGDAIYEWTQQLRKPHTEATLMYARFLKKINAVTRDAWDGFLRSLEEGNDATQRLLLERLIQLFRTNLLLLESQKEQRLMVILRNLCLSGLPSVRRQAIEAFGYLPRITEEERQFLVSLTAENDGTLAAQALISLGRQTPANQIEQLQSYLHSNRLEIRNAADEVLVRCWLERFWQVETDEVLSQVIDEMLRVLGNDPQRLYRTMLAAGQHRWFGNFPVNAAKLGGLLVERFPALLEQVIEDLTQLLERPDTQDDESIEQFLDQRWLKDTILFSVAAACAERMPSAFANLVDAERLQPHLIRFTNDGNLAQSADAVTLLSFLRRLSPETTTALRNGLNDTVYAQEAVLAAVARFRNVKGDIVSKLAPGLRDPSAAFAYATVQIFQALGTTESTSFADRQRIMKLLADAIANPSSTREIYVLKQNRVTVILHDGSRSTEDKGTVIAYLGLLKSAMYQALVQISGISGPRTLTDE